MAGEDEQTLILAGDIVPVSEFLQHRGFFVDVLTRFKRVYWLFGNHEYYGSNLEDAVQIVPEQDGLIFGDTFLAEDIIGVTLWTDFNRGCPLAQAMFAPPYSDSTMVFTQGRKVKTNEIAAIHDQHRTLLGSSPSSVVVTHHCPHPSLIAERWRNHRMWSLFACNDMESVLEYYRDTGCKLWIAGHSHTAYRVTIYDKISFVCNPLGYPNEDSGFDPYLVITL